MESKYQNKKESQKICASIFQDTYSKCQSNPVLSQSIQQSINSTKLYLEGNIFNLTSKEARQRQIDLSLFISFTEIIKKLLLFTVLNLIFLLMHLLWGF